MIRLSLSMNQYTIKIYILKFFNQLNALDTTLEIILDKFEID